MYLITTDLLNAWVKYIQAEDEYQAYIEGDFLNILNRNEIQIDTFPGLVQLYAEGKIQDPEPGVKEIAKMISGGVWIVSGSACRNISGTEFILHSRPDVIRGPVAFNIKYCQRYKTGDFFHCADHKLAFACFPGIREFHYLISAGKNVYTETYSRDGAWGVESIIFNFLVWLSFNSGYEKTYLEKWSQDAIQKEKQEYIDRMHKEHVEEKDSF